MGLIIYSPCIRVRCHEDNRRGANLDQPHVWHPGLLDQKQGGHQNQINHRAEGRKQEYTYPENLIMTSNIPITSSNPTSTPHLSTASRKGNCRGHLAIFRARQRLAALRPHRECGALEILRNQQLKGCKYQSTEGSGCLETKIHDLGLVLIICSIWTLWAAAEKKVRIGTGAF